MKNKAKFKFYKQHNVMDCGPVCLKMVIKYLGKDISTQILRDLCHTTREGSSIKSIINASEEIGIKAVAIKCILGINQANIDIPVLGELPFPLIAHWKGDHFVVIYKFQKNRFYIADPANGFYFTLSINSKACVIFFTKK